MKAVVFTFVCVSAFTFFFRSLSRNITYIRLGKPDLRFTNWREQVRQVFTVAFAQSKLLREPVAGSLHGIIFWGFNLFLFAVAETFLEGFFPGFSFIGFHWFYLVITGIQDIFGILVLAAIIFSLYRRFIKRVGRLQTTPKGKLDAAFVLCMIVLVVVSMFGQNSSRIAMNGFSLAWNEFRPASYWLGTRLFSANPASATAAYEFCWWLHTLTVLTFLNYLPYSKHFHVISAIPNVFLAKTGEDRLALPPLDLGDETAESFGVADIPQLTWKQLLDGFSCTECGRCSSVCPAATTGKSLSPRKIIVDIRNRTKELAPLLLGEQTSEAISGNTLAHNYISDTELWQCTTCNACVQECPVMIEHVGTIVDMRRNLVLTESAFPQELNPVFKSLETNYTPWAFPASERAAWAEGLNIKTMAEDANTEYLFWVGCAGSFDNRYKKVSRAFAQIMQKAGIDFRILGTEEKCNGDTARRLGNEYLAQTLMQENIGTLNGYGVKKIVTACPHCFNSLKHEYKQFGGNFEVLHHSQLIEQILNEGKLQLKPAEHAGSVTYHDSCYLGRYNDTYDAPRSVITAVPGVSLTEMQRAKSKGFCCGAGGGRMFLEDVEGSRINEERSREAISTGADTIASACPFCMTMLQDGVKSLKEENGPRIKDIAEIIWDQTV